MKNILLLGFIAFTVFSCGGGASSSSTTTSAPSTDAAPDTEQESATESSELEPITLEISGNDQLQFNKSVLSATAGQEVTLVLTHSGKMAKAVMGHNWVLLKQGTDITMFATKAISAAENEYIPEGDEAIAYTSLIGGGESTSVTFTAPAAGTYDFICTFPGHYAAMKGRFVVK